MAIRFRILAIDGGGIRGVIPAYILQQLEQALNGACYQNFDLIAGTSTGGIIALGLTSPPAGSLPNTAAVPYSATQILGFYMNDESQIFVQQASGDFYTAKYYALKTGKNPPNGIEPWLQQHFGAFTLAQAQQNMAALQGRRVQQVLVTCYTMNGGPGVEIGPYLFNWGAASKNANDNYQVWEAARSTSAAPTYFPVAQVGSGVPNGSSAPMRWAADGGVTANNPAMYALAAARQIDPTLTLDEILVVSLGTGIYNPAISMHFEDINWSDDTGNWGTIPWVNGKDANGHSMVPLLSVLSMSNVQSADQQLGDMMPTGNYYRLEPMIEYAESSMDATDVQALQTTAKNYISPGGAGNASYTAVVQALQSKQGRGA